MIVGFSTLSQRQKIIHPVVTHNLACSKEGRHRLICRAGDRLRKSIEFIIFKRVTLSMESAISICRWRKAYEDKTPRKSNEMCFVPSGHCSKTQVSMAAMRDSGLEPTDHTPYFPDFTPICSSAFKSLSCKPASQR